MPFIEYETYARWIAKWRPHLVYGAAASGGYEPAEAARPARRDLPVTKLPGADIVRAY